MLHSWEIEASELAFLEEVGQGASANVFKGKYRGQEVWLLPQVHPVTTAIGLSGNTMKTGGHQGVETICEPGGVQERV